MFGKLWFAVTKTALIVVDVQNDFLPGGSLAVPDGDAIIPVLNGLISQFDARRLPIVASRDWHPADHCSFQANGGPWPPHCVADTRGARFTTALELPADAKIVSKATTADRDAYSAFDGTELAQWLRTHGVEHVVIGGLATDYCVKSTAEDALEAGFEVTVVEDAVRAVNLRPDDGAVALDRLAAKGVKRIHSGELDLS